MKSAGDVKSPCFMGFFSPIARMTFINPCIKDGKNINPAYGTGGTLSVAEEYLKKLNASAKLRSMMV